MLSSLPSPVPRDSHAFWYSSNHLPSNPASPQEPVSHAFDHFAGGQNNGGYRQRRSYHAGSARSPLTRLRADELYLERRKQNVQNYGSSWIKPPGVFKSLHQLREERREMEEHQEALRREQLAQELAEAEAGDALLRGMGPDGDMEAMRDLDDEIPEANTTGMVGDDSDPGGTENDDEARRGMITQRLPDEVFREALMQGESVLGSHFAPQSVSEADGDDQSHILQEDDLIHEHDGGVIGEDGPGLEMDEDLDDGVPDADFGEYEHTDTEAELSTSDEDNVAADRWPHARALNISMVRSDGTQNSLEMGHMDQRNEVSLGRSSPRQGTGIGRHRRGPL